MLVLTQLSVGAFAVLWLLDLMGKGAGLTLGALASLGLAGMSLGASTLHLGRPIYAWRALKGLRRSWLSREVLTLSLFAGAASAFAGMLLFDLPGRGIAGLVTVLAGLAGVTSSARIYIVRARPAWFTSYTLAEFLSTAAFLGPFFVSVLLKQWTDGAVPAWIRYAAVAGAGAQLLIQLLRFLWLSRSEAFELRASSLLLSGRLRRLFLARLTVLIVAGVLPLLGSQAWALAAFGLALCGEWLGRYLFFVSVVPKNIAAAFTSGERIAA
jgi:DMSO reductase anchor subunit